MSKRIAPKPSPDEAFHILSREILRGPLPAVCPFYLLGLQCRILDTVDDVAPNDSSWTLLPKYDRYWDLGVAWLSMPRTTSEIKVLTALDCSCDTEQHEDPIHTYGTSTFKSQDNTRVPMYCIASFWLSFLAQMLVTPAGSARIVAMRDITRWRVWPQSLRQILPYGPEDTIRGLMKWFHADLDGCMITNIGIAMSQIIDLTYPGVYPSIYATTSLCPQIVACMRAAVELFNGGNVTGNDRFWNMCFHMFRATTSLLADIVVEYANEAQRALFLAPHVEEVLKAGSAGYDMLEGLEARLRRYPNAPSGYDFEDSAKLKTVLAILCGTIYEEHADMHRVHVNPRAKAHWMRRAPLLIHVLPHKTWVRFVRTMEKLEHRERCTAPGCTRIAVTLGDLRYCGGCRRFVYCSRRCQARAWTCTGAEHRYVCGVLHAFYLKYGLPKKGIQGWVNRVPPGESYVPAARMILNYVSALTHADMKTTSKLQSLRLGTVVSRLK
jgi:hypothetical protein